MTTCPRCGRFADEEFVCADCGAFLAGSEGGGTAAAVPVRRVAVLVLIVCLLGIGGAALLLRDGGGKHPADLSIPAGTGPVELSSAPGESQPAGTSGPVAAGPPTSVSSSNSATRSPSPTVSAHRSRSATPTSTHPSPTRPGSTSASPHPSTSTPHPSPSTSHSGPSPARRVALGQSGSSTCGQHCHTLIVTLSNFPAGSHRVNCFDEHARQFASYATSSTTSTGCGYDRPHASVYVVVDGTRSNTVSW